MGSNSRWTTGVIIAAVVILAIGGIAYGINKRHHTNTFVGEPAATTSNSDTTSTTSPPTSTATTPTTSAQVSTQSCIPASQAASQEGQTACVTFTVGYTYTSSKCNAYLDQYSNYSSGFSAWIPDGCGLGSTLISEYANKNINVTGTITSYNGAPEIEVTNASQVQLAQ